MLFHPKVYEWIQNIAGVTRFRRWLIREVLDLSRETRVLDLGCGTGVLATLLPDVDYTGLDNNPAYIKEAQSRYAGARTRFICSGVENFDPRNLGQFDAVISIGVLHHLDDAAAAQLFATAAQVLKPDGFLATLDPAYFPGQSWLSKTLTSFDRGKFVRTPPAYADLCASVLPHFSLRHRSNYNNFFYEGLVIYASKTPQGLEGRSRGWASRYQEWLDSLGRP